MRLIDADSMITRLENTYTKKEHVLLELGISADVKEIKDAIINVIGDQPTVDPVKHGHWIWTRNYTWHCSECGGLIATPGYMPTKDELPKRYRFCSQCGAKMDEVAE